MGALVATNIILRAVIGTLYQSDARNLVKAYSSKAARDLEVLPGAISGNKLQVGCFTMSVPRMLAFRGSLHGASGRSLGFKSTWPPFS